MQSEALPPPPSSRRAVHPQGHALALLRNGVAGAAPAPQLALAMSIYRCSMSSISRAAGRSSVAAAAYRAGARLRDARTGELHDYSRKRANVEWTALVGWDGERGELWNAAESAERRKDSKVAREVQVALPSELPAQVRAELALALALWMRERWGVAVDVAMHAPSGRSDQRNHHAHLLVSTRAVARNTFGAKTRELDVKPTSAREVEALRAAWEALANDALASAGAALIDRRSYERQEVERDSEHVGRAVVAMTERSEQTERGAERERRARGNRRRTALHATRPRPVRARVTAEMVATERAVVSAKERVERITRIFADADHADTPAPRAVPAAPPEPTPPAPPEPPRRDRRRR